MHMLRTVRPPQGTALFRIQLLAFAAIYGAVGGADLARAEFLRVIDVPLETLPQIPQIDSHTQINIHPGGVLPLSVTLGPTWSPGGRNIEVNLLGGTIGDPASPYGWLSTSSRWVQTTDVRVNLVSGHVWGDLDAAHGAIVTLSGAEVQGFLSISDGSLADVSGGVLAHGLSADEGSMVRISGGIVGASAWKYLNGVRLESGSTLQMSGGRVGRMVIRESTAHVDGGLIEGDVYVDSGGQLQVAGGSLGPLRVMSGGAVTLVGGEFRLGQMPLHALGASETVDLPPGSVLTGVLADGTPVTLAHDGAQLDYFAEGRVALVPTTVPSAEPRAWNAPQDGIPLGLRSGQSLALRAGATTPAHFAALPGSRVTINGGAMGPGFEATGAVVDLVAGSVGDRSAAHLGTTFRIGGGVVGSNFQAGPHSHVELSGGVVGPQWVARADSQVTISGGKFASLQTEPGSVLLMVGNEFRVNGVPLGPPETPGTAQPLELPELGVLSGTLADGTSFALASGDLQFLAPGTLFVQQTSVPTAGPPALRLPGDPPPLGLRAGQTLVVSEGGDLGERFTAGWGSTVRVAGGRVGEGLQAAGAYVLIGDGAVGSVDALAGAVVTQTGGVIESHVTAHRGGAVNLSGGQVLGRAEASYGGRVRIGAGHVAGPVIAHTGSSLHIGGGTIDGDVMLSERSELELTGGEVLGAVWAWGASQVDLRGGRLGDGLSIDDGGRLVLGAGDLRIDDRVLDLPDYGALQDVELPAGAVLSGVLADGTPFAFTTSDGDWFAPGTIRVRRTLTATWPLDVDLDLPGLPITVSGLRPGRVRTLHAGQTGTANFTAGWGSRLTVAGGAMGNNFEAVGAEVTVLDGVVGADMDLLIGAVVNVEGGVIAPGLTAHRGSVVNVSGGVVHDVTVRAGGVVNVTGGVWGETLEGQTPVGRASLEAGSELHLVGSAFALDGEPIAGLAPGVTVALEFDPLGYFYQHLSGAWLDGAPFAMWLTGLSWSPQPEWIEGPPLAVTLTIPSLADWDGNRLVDEGDLTVWQSAFGTMPPDMPGHDGSALLRWQREATFGGPRPLVEAVPEPGAGLLAALATGWAATAGQRRQRGRRRGR